MLKRKSNKTPIGGGIHALSKYKQSHVKKALLYMLAFLFCAVLCLGAVFSFLKVDITATAAVKDSFAYLDLDGSGKILNGFEGKQNEYVYFGTNETHKYNTNTGAIKWRVLSKEDDKYSEGKMLLWADYQIGRVEYNMQYDSRDIYTFWGTSKVRASLNGGNYYTGKTGAKSENIPLTDSWYHTLITTDEERDAVVGAKQYTTDCFGIDTSLSTYIFKKTGITKAGGGIGKYDSTVLNKHTYATSASAKVNGTGVQETTAGDKFFLLDYNDINEIDYGFFDTVDGNSVNYANKIAANVNKTWNTSSDWFPTLFDGTSKNYNNITATYLTFNPSANGSADCYWLRNSGHYDFSSSFAVNSNGALTDEVLTSAHGLRPALNLDKANIVYATTSKPTDSLAQPVNNTVKPEYKLYLKSSSYAANSALAKAVVGENDGTLSISYNNPIGTNNGKLVILLSDKTKEDGSVAYQAAVNYTSAASGKAFATIALPSGVSLANYNVNLLYTSANDGNLTETVYCSYSLTDGVVAPDNFSVDYDGSSKWISDLSASEKPAWLDLDIYNNSAFIKAVSISYKENLGNPATTIDKTEV
ncbi:MAG: hypothetical protein K2N23_01910, partial [Clostridia bacterium]|nr:hypothetical protein [Clostridia bacterium]